MTKISIRVIIKMTKIEKEKLDRITPSNEANTKYPG